MAQILSREIRLRRRPTGLPVEDDFALATVPIPELRDGELLVRNSYMSVDPYMRGRMNAGRSYVPPFQIGEALTGGCVGQVAASLNERFQAGDCVTSSSGWREYYISDWPRSDPDRPPRRPDPGLPGRARHAGPDRLCRPPGHRPAAGGRDRLRLGRRGRGGRGGLPDRQAQGLPRDWERRIAGQGRLAAGGSRHSCRVQLPRGGRSDRRSWAATARRVSMSPSRMSEARTSKPPCNT